MISATLRQLLLASIVVVAGGCGGSVSPAQPVVELRASPGEVHEGELAKWQFVIINPSADPLLLDRAKPTCGCIVGDVPRIVAPKSNATITFEMKTSDMSGRISKSATLIWGSDEIPNTELALTCTVIRPYIVKPERAVLQGLHGTPIAGEFDVIWQAGPVADRAFVENIAQDHVSVDGPVSADASGARFTVRLRAPRSERPVVLRDVVTIVLEGRGWERRIRVPVLVRHRAFVELEPSGAVMFRSDDFVASDDTGQLTAYKQLRVHVAGEFKDLHVAVDPELEAGIEAEVIGADRDMIEIRVRQPIGMRRLRTSITVTASLITHTETIEFVVLAMFYSK